MNFDYDIAIIGSGPAGFACALRAAGLGLKTCLIEKRLIGGTCLNWGCIPTKALAHTADLLRKINGSSKFGIRVSNTDIDIDAVLKYKDGVVSKLRTGAEKLLASKKIDVLISDASLSDANTIKTKEGSVKAKYIVIATGSSPAESGFLSIDGRNILSSKDLLALKGLPKSLAVIGGGFIGCEFAAIYNQLGVRINIIEITEQLLPGFDKEVARRLELILKKKGINVFKGKKVKSLKPQALLKIELEDQTVIEAEKALLCIGRRPNVDGLNLAGIGIDTDKGAIVVDKRLRTSIPNIYAIGDATAGFLLAHVAMYEGTLVAELISGREPKPDYSAVPSAIFTSPEIASVGLSAEEAEKRGIKAETAKLPFAAVSKAHIIDETEGFIKLIIEPGSKKILGALIFGPSASELIANFTLAIRNSLTADDISDTIFAHPTLSEGILDAAKNITA